MKSWKRIAWAVTALLAVAVMVGACVPVQTPSSDEPAGAGPASSVQVLNVTKRLTSAGTNTFSGTILGGSPLVFEGATDNAHETTLAVTDPTADRTITLPNSSGTVALNPLGASMEFEGTTADDYETTLAVADPTTPDKTITLPNATGTVMLSTLATNAPDAANSVTGASNGLVFEGVTANDYETTLTVVEPTTPDKTITLPNVTGTVHVDEATQPLTALSARIGGGYYSTGCDASSAGALQCVAGITSDGAILGNTGSFTSTLAATGLANLNGGIAVDGTNFTVSGTTGAVSSAAGLGALSARIGGGYYSTGCDISSAGVAQCVGGITSDATVLGSSGTFTNALTSDTAKIGGGYYSTGCTGANSGTWKCTAGITSDAGVLANTGTFTTSLTVPSAYIGGGYYSTGCTGWSDGRWKCVSDITSDANLIANTGSFTSTLAATGLANLNGGIAVDTSNFTVSGTTGDVVTAGDITITPDATGGNAGAKTELIGLPRIKLIGLATGTNGSTETTVLVDDSPTGEYAPIDADVTEAEGSASGVYKIGASSYKAIFAGTATAGDGFKRTIASDDWSANEYVGMFLYSSVALASGDLQIALTDDGGERDFNIGAVSPNIWTWVEVDVSTLDGATGDAITEFAITLTAQGATNLAAFNLYLDTAYKFDSDDSDTLGEPIIQDGVLSVVNAEAAGSLVEGTDYFVRYISGNDAIVYISNQSGADVVALVAY